MPCNPLSIQPGLFYTNLNWSIAPQASSSNGRSVSLDQSGLLISSSTGSTFHQRLGSSIIKYLFFGDGHLAVLSRDDTHVTVNIVDFSGSNPTEVNLFLSSISGPSTDDPVLQPSPGNGNVFLIYSADGAGALADVHYLSIRRSDNGDMLLAGPPPFHPTGQINGEATANELIIHYSSNNQSKTTSCPLPQGECDINPETLHFSERVIGGPAGTTTEIKSITIENEGTDCLSIQSISNNPPYTTSFSGPVSLSPGDDINVDITFTPTSVGSFNNVTLNVTRTPANGDSTITCNGSARNPILDIGFNSSNINFGTQPVGSTHTKNLQIRNDGEADLNVSVAPGNGVFTWASASQTLAPNASMSVTITYVPPDTNNHSATLTVTSNAPGSPHSISMHGTGCIAEAEINPQHSGPVNFGEVQQGFRTVRYFTVDNPGSGPLTFRARIVNDADGLFGLQTESGSVTDLTSTQEYTVNPVTPCGALESGSGKVIVCIAFFANHSPDGISADLIIDNHNAPNAQDSWTFPLSATVVQPTDVDAALVLDRSGSMNDVVGSRTKHEACITAGRLFVQLIRPDMQDRISTIKYNQTINVMQSMTLVTGQNQPNIIGQINSSELNPSGTTCIAGGAMVALKQLAIPRDTPSDSVNKIMLVLTDGKDNTAYLDPDDGQYYSIMGGQEHDPNNYFNLINTSPITAPADVKIYAVGLGKTDEIDIARLGILAESTGAYSGIINQDLTGEHYFDLEKYFTQVYMDAVDLAVISDPVEIIQPGQTHRIAFEVLRGDTGGLVVVYDKLNLGRLPYYLESPKGEIIDITTVPAGFQTRHGITETARFTEFKNPAGEEERYEGTWYLVVKHEGYLCYDVKSSQQTHLALMQSNIPAQLQFGFISNSCKEYPDPVEYGFSIGVGSNLRMQVYVSQGVVKIGDPIRLTAFVSEAGLPVNNCDVTVQVRTPGGNVSTITLLGSDNFYENVLNEGEYANDFTGTYESGGYEFLFRAVGYDRNGKPIIREAQRGKYVEGTKPVIPEENKPDTDDSCCRLLVRLLVIIILLLLVIIFLLWSGKCCPDKIVSFLSMNHLL